MASETEHPKRGDFVYGQGAADDEEGWAEGLAAAQWWVGKESILAEQTLEGCQARAQAVRETPLVAPALLAGGGGFTEICGGDGKGLGVAVGCWEAGAGPAVWGIFGAVINCGAAEHPGQQPAKKSAAEDGDAAADAAVGPGVETGVAAGIGRGRYLWLDISSGGKQTAAAKGLTKCLPSALEFASRALHAKQEGGQLPLLLHCDETEERSVAVAMAILAHCFPPTGGLDKASLRQLLCRVQEARPGATTP